MFKRDCYFIWLDGNNLAGRKPDKCRFHNVLACFAWLGSTALVLQVFEARKNPWIQRRTDRVRNGNLGVPLQRASGYQDWLHFYHFTLSIFLFFFFGENSCQNDESNNCILNIMDWLKVILAWKLFIQFHIFCQCIWRILIEKNGKKTYINLEEAKNFELPTFFLLQLINSSWLISLKSNR